MAIAISVMLVRTTVVNASAWNAMGASTLRDSNIIVPKRGEILAADGSILATNLYYFNVMIDFRASRFDIVAYDSTIPELSGALARLIPGKRDSLAWEKRLRKAIEKPKSKRTRNFVIVKGVPEETVNKIKQLPFFKLTTNCNRTGLKVDKVMKRSYPFGQMARMSIGLSLIHI